MTDPALPAAEGRHSILAGWGGVLLFALVLAAAGVGSHSIWTPDEPTGAAVGKAMWTTGDLAMPRLNGQPFLEKPPLYWWVQVAVFRLLGASDWTARLPSGLFAALTLLAVYALGRRLGGPRHGLLALLVLWTTAEFCEDMSRILVDPALVLFVTLAHCGFAVLVEPRSRREIRGAWVLIATAVPLAFLAKGIVGIGLAVGPPVLFLLATERIAALRRLLPAALLAVPLFALFVAPWVWALYRDGGAEAVRENLVANTVGRTLPTAAGVVYGHRNPFWYYLPNGIPALLPWLFALPAMLKTGLPRGPRRLLFATFVLGAVLLSVPSTKRALYLVPLLPALSICVAGWLDGLGERDESRWDRWTALVLCGLAAGLTLVLAVGALAARLAPADRFGGRAAPLLARLSAPGLLAFGTVMLVAGIVLATTFVRTLRGHRRLTAAWLVGPYVFLFFALQTGAKALADPLKNLHALTATIERLVPRPDPVTAYQPSESLQGIVVFDLGRTTVPLDDPQAVEAFFAAHPQGRLVIDLGDLRRLPPELRGRLRPLYDETGFKASPYAIVERF